jgi:hypothetical protein
MTSECSCARSDLIELNGDDLRREPLICRKSTLAVALARADDGIELNDHAELVFQHACKLGYEGIISKREDSPTVQSLPRLDQAEESEVASRYERGGGGLGEVKGVAILLAIAIICLAVGVVVTLVKPVNQRFARANNLR